MKFASFKEKVPLAKGPICDPCRQLPPASTNHPKDLSVWTQYMDWSVDDELLRMKLIGGKCPLCVGKVTAETTPNQVGVTWYGCSDNPNHLWEVDYNTKTITPF